MSQAPEHVRDQVSSILDGGNNYYDLKAYQYLLNFMEATDMNSPAAYNFCYGIEMYANLDDFPVDPKKKKKKDNDHSDSNRRYPYSKKPARGKVKEKDWNFLKEYFQTQIDEIGDVDTAPPVVVENFLKLADYLGFSDVDKTALEYLIVHGCHDYLDDVSAAICNKDEAVGPVIARMCQDEKNHKQYSRFISPTGKLIKYGLMEKAQFEYFPQLNDRVGETLAQPNLNKSDIVEAFVGKPTETNLDLSDFEYMGEEQIGLICDIIENATKDNVTGVNILIHGPAGGGKTELSRAISKRLGISMYAIGEDENNAEFDDSVVYDEFGDAIGVERKGAGQQTTGQKRLSDLNRAQSLLKGGGNAFLLFDEIEDLLLKGTDSEKAADTESKIAINRLLENNPVPVIWNGNDPEKFHQAVRDRFTFSIYVDHPPMTVRKKIWQKQVALQDVDLSSEDIDHLAREYDASPRKITLALKAAKVSGRGKKAVEMALPASARITHGSSLAIKDYSSTSRFYDSDFSNIKSVTSDNVSVFKPLAAKTLNVPFAILASGPKGSGLRSYARHLAEGLHMNIDEHSMGSLMQSDMMSSAEQKIASAFNAAADRGRFLAIHDAELLSGGGSDWDPGLTGLVIDMVRHHEKPMILTSTQQGIEFPDPLKFVFSEQVTLGTLDAARARKAFETFFGQKPPEMISSLDNLVIGDFSNVRKNLAKMDMSEIYGDDVVRMLERQMNLRQQSLGAGIGFRATTNTASSKLPPKPEGQHFMSLDGPISETMP